MPKLKRKGRQNEKEIGQQKANSKMTDLNPTILRTLNVNVLNTPIKKQILLF